MLSQGVEEASHGVEDASFLMGVEGACRGGSGGKIGRRGRSWCGGW